MSFLNLNNNLFLGKVELDRFQKFLGDSGYTTLFTKISKTFGIIKSDNDSNFVNFKIEAGSSTGTIKLANDSYAYDKNGKIIYKKAEDNMEIPDDSVWYWIKIKHDFAVIEEGIVSLSATGLLTGVGTKFTEVLRGQPNFASKIKFYGSSLNASEYEVQQVTSDTSAILSGASGIFTAESNLQYKVVGTFTPGVSVEESYKYPFQYDGCIDLLTDGLVEEITPGIAPTKTTDEEFYIARVRRVGDVVTIQDKRTEFWTIETTDISTTTISSTNPILGVEFVKYDSPFSTKSCNIIRVSWGFKSSDWTIDSGLRQITLNSGSGGKIKTTSEFNDGDFDGFRIYATNGTYQTIISSTASLSSIVLVLENLNPSDYTSNDELIITPDVEEISLKCRSDKDISQPSAESITTYPISQSYADIRVIVPQVLVNEDDDVAYGLFLYNILYRHKRTDIYTPWLPLPSDTDNGFLNESSFDINGNLDTESYTTYTSSETEGYIEVTPCQTAIHHHYVTKQLKGKSDRGVQYSVTYSHIGAGTTIIDNIALGVDFVLASLTLKNGAIYNLVFPEASGLLDGVEMKVEILLPTPTLGEEESALGSVIVNNDEIISNHTMNNQKVFAIYKVVEGVWERSHLRIIGGIWDITDGTPDYIATSDQVAVVLYNIASSTEIKDGVETGKFITPSGLAQKDGGLIVTSEYIIDPGVWDLNATEEYSVALSVFGLSGYASKIEDVQCYILPDPFTRKWPLLAGGYWYLDASGLYLHRNTGGIFNSVLFGSSIVVIRLKYRP